MSSQLYPYVTDGRDLRSGGTRNPWSEQSIEMLTEEELRAKFAEDDRLQQGFGDADNYMNYMNEFVALADAQGLDWWNIVVPHGTSNFEYAQRYDIHEEDARMGSGVRIDTDQDAERQARERYEAMAASPEMQQLMLKYSVNPQFTRSSGDIYTFNGLNFAETYEVDDTEGKYIEGALNLANQVALGLMTGAAGGAIGAAAGGGAVGGAVGGVSQAVLQGVANGGDFSGDALLRGAITGAVGGYIDGVEKAIAAGEDAGAIGNLLDNTAWDLAGTLNIDHETAMGIIGGSIEGLVAGQSLEDVTLGVIGNYGSDVLLANVDTGDLGVEVSNFFKEGETEIPHEAIESVLANGITAALGGDVSPIDVVKDYVDEGGSFAFLDPNLTGLESDFDLPEGLREIGREAEDFVRAVGSEIDDEVIQPVRQFGRDIDENVYQPLRPVLRAVDQAVVQPVGQALSEAETAVRRSLPDISLPEGPDIDLPEGPDIDLPDVNLPNVGLPQLAQGGMLGGRAGVAAPKFTPYQHQSLQFNPTIYQPPQTQKKDYVAELDNLISRGMLKA